ncbi:MAG: hypothetical protein KF801_03140 [Cryobacterium sp.]|nr:hypothetical protein [Cryobacterium sp.]
MTTLLIVVLASLALVFFWALVAPRSQWRVLFSWSYRDPHRDEPSGSAYLLIRLVALLGIASMATSAFLAYRDHVDNRPQPAPPPSAVERMWGSPDPVVVNRVITSASKPPKNLVDQPILGYQGMSGQTRQPPYLFRLPSFDLSAATTENGFIGKKPEPGLVGLDTAGMVVFVAADPMCFPHAAVIRETSDSVSIAVYYGQASPKDGSNKDNVALCNVRASGLNVSTLIPIPLSSPLGERKVLTLGGDPIRAVPLLR